MHDDRKKVLWLVSWYPNKYDLFDGDFIQRHARAASLYDDIHVLFLKQSEAQEAIENTCLKADGLTEQIIYLPKKKGILGKVQNFLCWQKIYRKQASFYIKLNRPAAIHVHVPWKAGLIALWIKKRYNLPFVVTEHWGIYNEVVDDSIVRRSFIFRQSLKRVFKEARTFVSVSRFLGEGVNRTLVEKNYTVIPNVVDTRLFYPATEKASRFTFLHVSNMVPLKNVEGILTAFQQFLAVTHADAQLVLIGNRDRKYVAFAEEMGLLGRNIFFRGEVPNDEVAKEMQKAHAFVLNSNIENSPCVIGEALCCGLPVIATNVGGIPELVSPKNSILIPPKDTNALAGAFVEMFTRFNQYNTIQVASEARQIFSFSAIGEKIHYLY